MKVFSANILTKGEKWVFMTMVKRISLGKISSSHFSQIWDMSEHFQILSDSSAGQMDSESVLSKVRFYGNHNY
jgi:hypothetical protein